MTLDSTLRHPDIARLRDALSRSPGRPVADEPGRKWAAIALTFHLSSAGEPELLMIKRAEHPGDPWSGHVAVPGGRRDPVDADLSATAIRETREEMGFDLGDIGQQLGTLDDLAPRTPYLPPLSIRPFVFAAPPEFSVTTSGEVARWFWVPLSAIRDKSSWGLKPVLVRDRTLEERTFTYQEHVVWGLTERVMRQLVTLLD